MWGTQSHRDGVWETHRRAERGERYSHGKLGRARELRTQGNREEKDRGEERGARTQAINRRERRKGRDTKTEKEIERDKNGAKKYLQTDKDGEKE